MEKGNAQQTLFTFLKLNSTQYLYNVHEST